MGGKSMFLVAPSRHLPPLKLQQVEWRKADALNPATYADILPTVNAVVHTIGTLLDNTNYKQKMAEGDVMGFIKSIAGRSNPAGPSAYETLNYETGA